MGTAADSAVSRFNRGCRAAVSVSVDIGGGEEISADEKGRLKKILKHTGCHGAARGVETVFRCILPLSLWKHC